MVFTAIIAFVAAYQVSSFRTVDTFAYNSTFITGNLRSVGDGLFEAFFSRSGDRAAGRRKFIDLSIVIVSFLLGAVLGSYLAPRYANHTLWFTLPPLAALLALTEWSPRSGRAESSVSEAL